MNKWDAAQFFPWWGQAIRQALGIVMDKHLTQKFFTNYVNTTCCVCQ